VAECLIFEILQIFCSHLASGVRFLFQQIKSTPAPSSAGFREGEAMKRPKDQQKANLEPLFTPVEWTALADELGLSGRERQILEVLSDGLKDAGVAQRLAMPANTVRSHLTRLHRKLGVPNRAALLVQLFKTFRRLERTRPAREGAAHRGRRP
jgi:ATP/maltotriose-dependent transcriptional regulator MalT